MTKDLYCIIMAGGVGSRFWPMSRQSMPKQFIDVLGTGQSLIQLTYERFLNICDNDRFLAVTSEDYRSLVESHLPAINPEQILTEPIRRNTAPCIAYAAYKLRAVNEKAVMVVTPADHIVTRQREFDSTLKLAVEHAANTGRLVTVGIKPTRPDTGYGYIQFHREDTYGHEQLRAVKTFTEKPDLDLAIQFLQSGDFYWNSGMFIWRVDAIIQALEKHLPDTARLFEEEAENFNTPREAEAVKRIYAGCQTISIDYGVMEQADNVDVVLGDFGWSDLGTWGALYEQLKEQTHAENITLGGIVRTYDSAENIVKIPKDKLAVIQGLTNYIVIDTGDVLLICQRDEEQKIKQFVNDLKSSKELARFL
ncbi:MAG: mannose-1-phosphate guanylyltransferase [Salibacteraceae bacterium]